MFYVMVPMRPGVVGAFVVLGVVAGAACASFGAADEQRDDKDAASESGDADGGSGDADVGVDVAADVTSADDGAACSYAVPTTMKTCAAGTDCTYVIHQVDCCGTEQVFGVNKSSAAAVVDLDTMQRGQTCACPPTCMKQKTTNEDGRPDDPLVRRVRCEGTLCKTYAP